MNNSTGPRSRHGGLSSSTSAESYSTDFPSTENPAMSRTSRINKRSWLSIDGIESAAADSRGVSKERNSIYYTNNRRERRSSIEEQQQQQQQSVETDATSAVPVTSRVAEARVEGNEGRSEDLVTDTSIDIQKETEDVKRLTKAFETIGMSMNDTRERLQIFFKAADEANTLLDMWIGVFAQAEYTQRLLLDPTWEGPQREEERERELQRQRSAYQQALEEDIRQENLNIQSQYNNNASSNSNWNSSNSTNHPVKFTKPPVSTVSSTRPQSGAVAANRKRGVTNTNARARR